MPSMPWVKIYTEMLDDPKMSDLEPEEKWLFIELILLAGECDESGMIRMTISKIAWRLRENQDSLKLNLNALEAAGLIGIAENGIMVKSFAKRQDRPQSVKQAQWNDAQRRHRATKKSVIDDTSMTPTPVILVEEEEDREEDGDSAASDSFDDMRIMIEKLTGNPIPPTAKEVAAVNEFIRMEATEEDFRDALSFLSERGILARGAAGLLGSVRTSHTKRIQKNNGRPAEKPYIPEEHATEVYQ